MALLFQYKKIQLVLYRIFIQLCSIIYGQLSIPTSSSLSFPLSDILSIISIRHVLSIISIRHVVSYQHISHQHQTCSQSLAVAEPGLLSSGGLTTNFQRSLQPLKRSKTVLITYIPKDMLCPFLIQPYIFCKSVNSIPITKFNTSKHILFIRYIILGLVIKWKKKDTAQVFQTYLVVQQLGMVVGPTKKKSVEARVTRALACLHHSQHQTCGHSPDISIRYVVNY